MNPDIASNIEAGGCVRLVYLTASDAGEGDGYMLGRERGVRAAYAYMAHQPDEWTEDTAVAGGHTIARFTLKGNPRVQLWHMRLKDPWLGQGWQPDAAEPRRVRAGPERRYAGPACRTLYPSRAGRHAGRPDPPVRADHGAPSDDTISVPYTQLCWRCAGHGHPDHIASARLVREATLRVPGNYAEAGYIDYPSQERASNLDPAEIAGKSVIFQHYAWNDYHYCAGPSGCKEPAGPAAAWVQRALRVAPGHHAAAVRRRARRPGGVRRRRDQCGRQPLGLGPAPLAEPGRPHQRAAGQLHPCRRHGGPDGA